jgi:hypothetical protein
MCVSDCVASARSHAVCRKNGLQPLDLHRAQLACFRIGPEISPQGLEHTDVIVFHRGNGRAVSHDLGAEAAEGVPRELARVRVLPPLFPHQREEHTPTLISSTPRPTFNNHFDDDRCASGTRG